MYHTFTSLIRVVQEHTVFIPGTVQYFCKVVQGGAASPTPGSTLQDCKLVLYKTVTVYRAVIVTVERRQRYELPCYSLRVMFSKV